jgi:trimethylamine--corrinoid protein Co-methyltransferase
VVFPPGGAGVKRLRAFVEVLSRDELQAIHDASLRILERTGMSMPHDECLDRCERHGARVDREAQVMHLPVKRMEEFIATMRGAATLPVDPLERGPLAGEISTQIHVVDYGAKTRRPGSTDDILKGIALVRHLDHVPHANAVCVAADVDRRVSDIHAFRQIYTFSRKPGGTYILSPRSAETIMDMAESIGRKEFYLFESVSPLRFRRETLEMGLLFARRGHRLGIAPMIMGGSTAPATLAGMCTLINAEVLGSLFAIHALTDEVPALYVHGSHAADPKTLLCSFGSPSQALLGIATAQMAGFYGLASGSNSALSDSLQPDFQCGIEKGFNALFSCLAGTVGIGCQGIAGADQGFSFEQLVIDNEWLDAWRFVVSGFTADAETIAEELIERVGIGGDFIAEDHTVEHLGHSWWHSRLFERLSWESWTAAGATSLLDRAHRRVEELTEGYRTPEPVLPAAQAVEVARIADRAIAEIAGRPT